MLFVREYKGHRILGNKDMSSGSGTKTLVSQLLIIT